MSRKDKNQKIGRRPAQKSSKISNALKKYFVDAIKMQGMNIKNAAKKYRINYSTAKNIYKKYKADQLAKIQEQKRIQLSGKSQFQFGFYVEEEEKEKYRCSYKEIDEGRAIAYSFSTDQALKMKINVVSTVGWDFMFKGLQSFS